MCVKITRCNCLPALLQRVCSSPSVALRVNHPFRLQALGRGLPVVPNSCGAWHTQLHSDDSEQPHQCVCFLDCWMLALYAFASLVYPGVNPATCYSDFWQV